jgi:hypothetical protein
MPLTANPQYTGKDTAGLEFEPHHRRLAIVVAHCFTATDEFDPDNFWIGCGARAYSSSAASTTGLGVLRDDTAVSGEVFLQALPKGRRFSHYPCSRLAGLWAC